MLVLYRKIVDQERYAFDTFNWTQVEGWLSRIESSEIPERDENRIFRHALKLHKQTSSRLLKRIPHSGARHWNLARRKAEPSRLQPNQLPEALLKILQDTIFLANQNFFFCRRATDMEPQNT